MAKEKRKIAVADCETDPFQFGRVPFPFIWGFYSPDHGFMIFDTTAEFMDFIRDEDIICYIHNGGKFDFHYFIEYFNKLEPILVINSRLVKGRVGTCEFRDSYAILPVPLAAYQKTKVDYSLFEPGVRDKPENRAIIIDYLKDDCIFLYELVIGFTDTYGRQVTIASAAIKQLQKIEGIKIENSGDFYYNNFQKFYFGGRVEALNPGLHQGNIQYLDINSAYPFAMKHPHPIGFDYAVTTNKSPKIRPDGFYEIVAKSYGAFCRREKSGLIFDWDGEPRHYFTTGHEILAAVETNSATILEHKTQYHFDEVKDFSKYVNHFWDIRQTTKKGSPENIYAKLFLNSAYGKFCSNPQKYKSYLFCDGGIAEYMTQKNFDIAGTFDGTVLLEKDLEKDAMRFFNVATGASITGFVRAMLLRAIKNVNGAIYCDTDSIMMTGSHGLELSGELGAWKLEGEFVEAAIAGKKLYGIKDKKGETKTASKGGRLEYKEVKLLLKGHSITKNPENPVFSLHKKPHFLKKTFTATAKRAKVA